MEFDNILLEIRNSLVCYWGQLAEAGHQNALMATYTGYAKALDLLDPLCTQHVDKLENALFVYRQVVSELTLAAALAQESVALTHNQQILQAMKREPISLEDERLLEAAHGC